MGMQKLGAGFELVAGEPHCSVGTRIPTGPSCPIAAVLNRRAHRFGIVAPRLESDAGSLSVAYLMKPATALMVTAMMTVPNM